MKSQLNILVIIVDVDLKPQVCEIDDNVIAMTGGKMIIFEIKDNFEIRKEIGKSDWDYEYKSVISLKDNSFGCIPHYNTIMIFDSKTYELKGSIKIKCTKIVTVFEGNKIICVNLEKGAKENFVSIVNYKSFQVETIINTKIDFEIIKIIDMKKNVFFVGNNIIVEYDLYKN